MEGVRRAVLMAVRSGVTTPILQHIVLDREPWPFPAPAGAVWVFRGPSRDPVPADPVPADPVIAEAPPEDAVEAWLVDVEPRPTVLGFSTPYMQISVHFVLSVTDPVALVRAGVTDAEATCRAFLVSAVPELSDGDPGLFAKLRDRSFETPKGLRMSRVMAVAAMVPRPGPGNSPWAAVTGRPHPPVEGVSGAPPGLPEWFELEQEQARGDDAEDEPWWRRLGRRKPTGATSPPRDWATPPIGEILPPTVRAAEPGGRQLVAQMPAGVPTGELVGLQVRVVAADFDGPVSVAARMPGLVFHSGDTQVTVVVHAESGLVADGPLLRTVRVPEHGDSEPVLFAFRAVAPGLHRVDVKAYAGGSFLAELRAEVSVGDRARRIDAPAQRAALGPVAALPGEVTLQVQADDAGHYVFQILSDRTQFSPVTVSSLAGPPGPAVEQVLGALSRIARGADYTGRNAREWLRQSGVNLWNQLVPAAVKEQFWQVRESMSAFTVATGHDIVPWELLYPLRPGSDDGFLIEQVPVVRRVFDQARSARIGIGEPRYVVPSESPADALAEVAAVAARLGGVADPVIDELDELLDLVESGRLGMVHFACHNNYRADAGSAIRLRNGAFLPVMLSAATVERSLAGNRPLIFINACRSAGEVPQYTRMMGWAKQFMAAGAGAFVGTLWDIRSRSAAAFADGFYQRLADGRTLGEAAHETRLASASDRGDPTWLAYSVYGDPAATAATGREEIRATR
jgi:hypothetical protein